MKAYFRHPLSAMNIGEGGHHHYKWRHYYICVRIVYKKRESVRIITVPIESYFGDHFKSFIYHTTL